MIYPSVTETSSLILFLHSFLNLNMNSLYNYKKKKDKRNNEIHEKNIRPNKYL